MLVSENNNTKRSSCVVEESSIGSKDDEFFMLIISSSGGCNKDKFGILLLALTSPVWNSILQVYLYRGNA